MRLEVRDTFKCMVHAAGEVCCLFADRVRDTFKCMVHAAQPTAENLRVGA